MPNPLDNKLSTVHPELARRWRLVAADMLKMYGETLIIAEAFRSPAQQLNFWKIGRKQLANGAWIIVDAKAVVTRAPPGSSWHEFGLALDSCFAGPDAWLEHSRKHDFDRLWDAYGKQVEAHGLRWGADWDGDGKRNHDGLVDRPHMEMSHGLTLSDARKYLAANDLKGLWAKALG